MEPKKKKDGLSKRYVRQKQAAIILFLNCQTASQAIIIAHKANL